MGQLTERDRQIIEEMKKNGILKPLNGYQLDYRNGFIMVACSDGDQFYNLYTRHAGIGVNNPNHTRIHVIAINGGALFLSPSLPQSEPERGVVLKCLIAARELKNMNSVALYAHAPCDIAGKLNLSVVDVVGHLLGAKHFLEEVLEFQAACFLHICYDNETKDTYHIHQGL